MDVFSILFYVLILYLSLFHIFYIHIFGREKSKEKGERKLNMSEDIFCVGIHFTTFELEMMNYFEMLELLLCLIMK